MNQSAVEYLAEKLLENQTYDRDGYVIIDLSVEHLEYLVQRAKQIEELNLKTAVEWLVKQLENHNGVTRAFEKCIQEAKEMEKEQIIDTRKQIKKKPRHRKLRILV
jgi:hypothetical protein